MINIFDKYQATNSSSLTNLGGVIYAANGFVTDYLPIVQNELYISNKASSIAIFYDSGYKIISVTELAAGVCITPPIGAAFIRFNQNSQVNADSLMFGAGDTLPSTYVPYGFETSLDFLKATTLSIRKALEQAQPVGRNIFDKNRARIGYSISYVNGSVFSSPNLFVTGLLPVTPGDFFTSSYGTNALCWYDINGKFISGSTAFNSYGKTPISVPPNAWFVQFQGTPVTRIESLMVTNGQTLPQGYQPFAGGSQSLPLQNKKIIWLGDSITYNGLYQPYVLSGTGMSTLANYGVPGQGVRTMVNSINETTIADADVISIFGGTNDYGGNRRLGSINDCRPDYDEISSKSFYYDLYYVLDKIYRLKPSIKIFFSTPLKRGLTQGQNYIYPAANGQGAKLDDYVQAVKDVCALFSVPVCDLFNESGINLYNLSIYTSDNLHPNAAGSAMHSRAMITIFNGK